MKFNLKISKLVFYDLEDIWEYSAEHWSKQQSKIYSKDIIQVIKDICKNAELGKPIDFVKRGHRRIIVTSHMMVYKIKNEIIFEYRILYQIIYR
jgi:plasmid stabilization system protein ParE